MFARVRMKGSSVAGVPVQVKETLIIVETVVVRAMKEFVDTLRSETLGVSSCRISFQCTGNVTSIL
jgi:hypothetical protein